MPPLRYSDRKKLAEQGTLGPLDYDDVPTALRTAVASIYTVAARAHAVGGLFDRRVVAACTQHFGKTLYEVNSSGPGIAKLVESPRTPVTDVLDIVEFIAEEAVRPWRDSKDGRSQTRRAEAEVENRLNTAFVRHRFGYRIDAGQVLRIGSPALDEAITGPALFAAAKPGWQEVDRSFRNALHHRRGGPNERDAAITDAHAALEAAMKAAGLKGDRLSALAKSFRNSGIGLPHLEGVPDALDTLLKRSSAIRDSLGDAHGKPPSADPVPDGVVDLAIHWTGAFIVYLAEAAAST